jgi:hypothetical protein
MMPFTTISVNRLSRVRAVLCVLVVRCVRPVAKFTHCFGIVPASSRIPSLTLFLLSPRAMIAGTRGSGMEA